MTIDLPYRRAAGIFAAARERRPALPAPDAGEGRNR
ncbi:hypothetical protein GGE65_000918 [Skermanella aerolata]